MTAPAAGDKLCKAWTKISLPTITPRIPQLGFYLVAVRRELNRVLLVLLAIVTLGALACSGGDDDAAAGAQATPATPAPTSTLEIAPTQAPPVLEIAPTQAPSVLEIAPTQAPSVLEIAPTQAPSVLEIAPTQTPAVLEIAPTQVPSVGPTDTSRDLTDFPFSTADLRQAIETAGYSFRSTDEHRPHLSPDVGA